MSRRPTLQALLAAKGVHDYRELADVLDCSRQMAHMYWHGYRCLRDHDTGAQVRIPVRMGYKVASRLSRALAIPVLALLEAVPAPPKSSPVTPA